MWSRSLLFACILAQVLAVDENASTPVMHATNETLIRESNTTKASLQNDTAVPLMQESDNIKSQWPMDNLPFNSTLANANVSDFSFFDSEDFRRSIDLHESEDAASKKMELSGHDDEKRCVFLNLETKRDAFELALHRSKGGLLQTGLLDKEQLGRTMSDMFRNMSQSESLMSNYTALDRAKYVSTYLTMEMKSLKFDTTNVQVTKVRKMYVVSPSEVTASVAISEISGSATFLVSAEKTSYDVFGYFNFHPGKWDFWNPHPIRTYPLTVHFSIPSTLVALKMRVLFHEKPIAGLHSKQSMATPTSNLLLKYVQRNYLSSAVPIKELVPIINRIYIARVNEVAIRPQDMELTIPEFGQNLYDNIAENDPAYDLNRLLIVTEENIRHHFGSYKGKFLGNILKQFEQTAMHGINYEFIKPLSKIFTPSGCQLTSPPWYTTDEALEQRRIALDAANKKKKAMQSQNDIPRGMSSFRMDEDMDEQSGLMSAAFASALRGGSDGFFDFPKSSFGSSGFGGFPHQDSYGDDVGYDSS